jgi:deoxyribose-phosphate aldolase
MEQYIDHTFLRPDATLDDIELHCSEAVAWGFASVCVNPIFVSTAQRLLANSNVAVGTVIDFPLGSSGAETKGFQTIQAVSDGARELDVVMNISALKRKAYLIVTDEIRTVIERARKINPRAITKVIIETCYLDNEEKKIATDLAVNAGANFVKTSTGFGTAGATVEDVKLIKAAIGGRGVQVKASGGIKDIEQATMMLNAGATRIGTSSGIKIIQQCRTVDLKRL